MSKEGLKFSDKVLEELRDPEFAALYLNEHLDYEGELKQEFLLQAFSNLIEAHGASQLAKKTKIARRTLYSAFEENGNPTLATLIKLMSEIGVTLEFKHKIKKAN